MRLKLLVASLALFAVATSASATVVYSDFGAGQSFNEDTGWTVSGPSSPTGNNFACAADFTPSSDATLGSITLGFAFAAGSNSFDFALADDNSGEPGTAIETWSGISAGTFGTDSIVTLDSALNPTLTAGVTYWITALPGNSSAWGAWDWNSVGANDPSFSGDGGSTWTSDTYGSTAPAFEVDSATAVPTPAALPAGLILIAGLVGFRKFNKMAV